MAPKKSYSRYFIILQEDEKGYALEADKLPSGYTKLEMKNNKCKVSCYVQNLKKEKQPYYMVLVCNKKDVKKIINITKMNIDDYGRVDVSYEYDINDIANSGISMDKITGAAIVKFIDSSVLSVMSGFTTTDIPREWRSFEVVKTKEEIKEEEKKDTVNEFERYEAEIEELKEAKVEEDSAEVKEREQEERTAALLETVDREEGDKENNLSSETNEIQIEVVKKEDLNHKELNRGQEDKEESSYKETEEMVKEETREEEQEIQEATQSEVSRIEESTSREGTLIEEENREERVEIEKEQEIRVEEVVQQEEKEREKTSQAEMDKLFQRYQSEVVAVQQEMEHALEERLRSFVQEEVQKAVAEKLAQQNDLSKKAPIEKREERPSKERNDFAQVQPRGPMGNYFRGIVEGLEEATYLAQDIPGCKWYKVPVQSLHQMYNTLDYNKYSMMYYPMISYYPYIKKYNHYLLGCKCDKEGNMQYIIYGIPGTKIKTDQPFGGKSGFVTWISDKDNSELGYWLMFYDYKRSSVVVPTRK